MNRLPLIAGLAGVGVGLWFLMRKPRAEEEIPPPDEAPPEQPELLEPQLINLTLPDVVKVSSEFYPEVTLFLPSPNPHYYWELRAERTRPSDYKILMAWNFLPPAAKEIGYIYGYRALDEPSGFYTIKGDWGWTPYPYQAIVVPSRAPNKPGIYQLHARLTASTIVAITQTDFEISAPQETYIREVIGQLEVIP